MRPWPWLQLIRSVYPVPSLPKADQRFNVEDNRPLPIPKLIHIHTMIVTRNLVTYMHSDDIRYTWRTSQRYSQVPLRSQGANVTLGYVRPMVDLFPVIISPVVKSCKDRLEVAFHEYLQYAYSPSGKPRTSPSKMFFPVPRFWWQ